MVDQNVKIANIPDSGSPERVALDLLGMCINQEKWDAFQTRAPILDLYAECLKATKGHRTT